MTPERTIARLSLYRRLLRNLLSDGAEGIYSHQLAALAGRTAAQVRRDFMVIGYFGSPSHGYDVAELLKSIEDFLDGPEPEPVALVGVGNLGRAILAFFRGRRSKLTIQAAFDADPKKVTAVINGCRCYHSSQLQEVVSSQSIHVGIIAVPAPKAQEVADSLVRAGVRGILNFAPARLRVPPGVFVEDIDMTVALEKVAYFARENVGREGVKT